MNNIKIMLMIYCSNSTYYSTYLNNTYKNNKKTYLITIRAIRIHKPIMKFYIVVKDIVLLY